jgi:hypothetical protein
MKEISDNLDSFLVRGIEADQMVRPILSKKK